MAEARKIAQNLEENSYSKEALLLNQRIKLCEVALNLAERAKSMPLDEMKRCVDPLQEAGVDFPFSMQMKFVIRFCSHHAITNQDAENFLEVWSPWAMADVDDFDPHQPLMKSLVAILADRETQLNSAMEDVEETGNTALDAKNKAELDRKNKELTEEWEAAVHTQAIETKVIRNNQRILVLHLRALGP